MDIENLDRSDCEKVDEILKIVKDEGEFRYEKTSGDEDYFNLLSICIDYIKRNELAEYAYVYVDAVTANIISQKGENLLLKGGITNIYKKKENLNNERNELERIQKDNLILQNEKMKYEKTIRTQESIIRKHQVGQAIAWALTILLTGLLIFLKR